MPPKQTTMKAGSEAGSDVASNAGSEAGQTRPSSRPGRTVIRPKPGAKRTLSNPPASRSASSSSTESNRSGAAAAKSSATRTKKEVEMVRLGTSASTAERTLDLFRSEYADGRPLLAFVCFLSDLVESKCDVPLERATKIKEAFLRHAARGNEKSDDDSSTLFTRLVAKFDGKVDGIDADFTKNVYAGFLESFSKIRGVSEGDKDGFVKVSGYAAQKNKKLYIDQLLGGNGVITDANAVKFFTRSRDVSDFAKKYFGYCFGQDSVAKKSISQLSALPDAMLDNMVYRVLHLTTKIIKPEGGMPSFYPTDDGLAALLEKEGLLTKDAEGKSFLSTSNIRGGLMKALFTTVRDDKKAPVRTVVDASVASVALAYVVESEIATKTRAAAAAKSKAAQ